MTNVIGTHSGAFQADEALGVWMLRRLPQFGGADAVVIRSRDPKVLEPLPIVIDVGGTYDHAALRYDHHQRGFFETFDGAVGAAKGPEEATGRFKTKLSAAGLVYKHYGREVICELHPSLRDKPDDLEWVLNKMYKCFMEGLDANDNGIEIADETRYKEGTSLGERVHRLNARWNEPPGGPSEDERFEKASALCGDEFSSALEYIVGCELPARTLVDDALRGRGSVHPGGEVVVFSSGGCPWKSHLYELERAQGVSTPVKFVLCAETRRARRLGDRTARSHRPHLPPPAQVRRLLQNVARAGRDRRGHRLHQPTLARPRVLAWPAGRCTLGGGRGNVEIMPRVRTPISPRSRRDLALISPRPRRHRRTSLRRSTVASSATRRASSVATPLTRARWQWRSSPSSWPSSWPSRGRCG